MADRWRERNFNIHRKKSGFRHVFPRSEHNYRVSMPSTSRDSCSSHSNSHEFNKRVTYKTNDKNSYQFRKKWENKTYLIRKQLNSESSRNNTFIPRSHNYSNSYKNRASWSLKESITGWYSIIIPHITDCEEVLNLILSYISPVVFYPYNKQFFGSALRFLVDDFMIAKTLLNTSYKITLKNYRKLVIKVFQYVPSLNSIILSPVSNEVKDVMMKAIEIRYNSRSKNLDLSHFYASPVFIENQMFVSLNRPAVLLASFSIFFECNNGPLYSLSLENNNIYLDEGIVWLRRLFPDLKVLNLAGNKFSSFRDLKCLSGYSIEVLDLSRNPVSDIKEKKYYKQKLQELFPMLKKLDNSDLPSRYSAIVGSKLKMPTYLGNSYPLPDKNSPEEPNSVVTLVESFLIQYYERYDNHMSRLFLAEAYHENAKFSLSCCFLLNNYNNKLNHYLMESRNFIKNPDRIMKKKGFVHRGRENIIHYLDKLPKTKHDMGSFIIDVPFANSSVVQIVVNGVFAENFYESHKLLLHSFCRTFCIVPFNDGWCILSDMIFITDTTHEFFIESSKRFHISEKKEIIPKEQNFMEINNGKVFLEDMEDSSCTDTSSQSVNLPEHLSPLYQLKAESSIESSSMSTSTNVQQSQSTNQQSPQVNSTVTTLSLNSIPVTVSLSSPANQIPLNSDCHVDVNPHNQLIMIQTFSNEFGMNDDWTKKCLEENGWDYAKAALCFTVLKPNIPATAFIRKTI